MITRRLSTLAVISACSLMAAGAWALPSDARQPIHVSADQLKLDDSAGTAIYTGNVDMTQGSMKLEAHRVDIKRGSNGEVSSVTARGQGTRAYLEQKPNQQDAKIQGWGDTVIYHAASRRVELIGNAKLIQAPDTFNGAYVEYFLDKRQVNARGSRSSANQNQAKDGRVEMTLTPNSSVSNDQ
ncbi:lipopolysaccharide transport periplasmic protein LptA [Larsenimonas salina]|uniref:lipopolysaccharide transport periplasmic protein LptA n=1 Tax=Larsenimonas salina TaxID=1295565 RepID=UPI0020738983|nr:lipopolysaccharide transport periplasmic protein LptA [Larsenimonas salina]MCM5703111.1 lipopolysaccharide transport periplasmic protein LptA [Larsenimonas salina]